VNVAHSNVTFRNCKFVNGGLFVTDTNGNLVEDLRAAGTVAVDCEFDNAGLLGRGLSMTRCHIYGLRNTDFARNVTDATWESCLFEDWYATSTDPHMDGLQYFWGGPVVTQLNFTMRGCYFNLDTNYPLVNQQNAALFLCGNSGSEQLSHITVENNWFKCGGYPIRLYAKNDASIQINNNIWEDSGWGPILASNRPGHGISNIGFSGNQIWVNGSLQPFEKPDGTNGDLWAFE
jgi:hypothetical protein